MKLTSRIIILSFLSFFLLHSNNCFCQYLETFSTPNKGILQGPCGASSNTCASFDFAGVNWFINGNLAGIDSGDFISTDGTDLSFEDVDDEVCWESPAIDISGVSGNFSISVDLTWVGFDSEDFINVDYKIDRGAWVQVPNIIGGGAGTIQYTSGGSGNTTVNQTGLSGAATLSIRVCTDFNGFGTFENAHMDNVNVPETGAVVLPVELISFKAENQEKEVMLKWITASELNNKKFEIEHRTNERAFQKIGEIKGNGTTFLISQYFFHHDSPPMGPNYYRLKQIDFDNSFDYSDVVYVHNETKQDHIGLFYPNPNETGSVNLLYTAIENSNAEIYVYNMSGKSFSRQSVELVKGENNLNFDFKDLTKGIYFVEIKSESLSTCQKLIIK